MTATLATALLLQVATLSLLRCRLGRTWLRRPAVVLVLISVVTQGATQALLLSPSLAAQDSYRDGLAPQFPSEACELLSGCTIAFAIGYLLIRPERSVPGGSQPSEDLPRAMDWRWLTAAAAPLAVLTYAGKGYNAHAGPQAGLGTSIATSFLLLTVTAAAASFVLRHGARWTLPVLLVQSAVLAAAGERTPVIACGVALVVVLAHAGVRVPKAQIAAGAVLVAAAVLAVTGSRVTNGRQVYYSDSGASGRFSALSTGITEAGSTGSLAAQAVTRLDDVSFTAAILQARSLGYPRLPASYVPGSLIEVVPSFLWPSKLSHAADLAPAQMEINDLGLQQTNYLPGFAGTYAGFLPPWGLAAFMAVVGLACGLGERRLLARCTAARLVLLVGAVQAAFLFDAGLPAMTVTLRSALALVVFVRVMSALRARAERKAARPSDLSPKLQPVHIGQRVHS
jgi:hypothetical protein